MTSDRGTGLLAACLIIVFLKSFVSCQALAEALKQNSSVTNLYLGSNNIGPDGAKAWCSVRMGPDGVMTGRGIKAPPYGMKVAVLNLRGAEHF